MPAPKTNFPRRILRVVSASNQALVTAALGLMFAVAAFAHGDVHVRIAAVTEQIAKEPKNARLFLERGELHREHQDWESAEADYNRAAQLDPKLATVDFCRANLLADSGKLSEARAMLDRYLARNPQDGHARVARARVLVKLGDRKSAVADFTSAIQVLREPQPEFFLERAQALVADGRTGEALRGLDEGVKRLGPIVTLQLFAIDLELERKAYDAALGRLETISSRATRKEMWLARRGDIELLAGRPSDAQKSFEAALSAVGALPARLQHSQATMGLKARVEATLAGITNAVDKGRR